MTRVYSPSGSFGTANVITALPSAPVRAVASLRPRGLPLLGGLLGSSDTSTLAPAVGALWRSPVAALTAT